MQPNRNLKRRITQNHWSSHKVRWKDRWSHLSPGAPWVLVLVDSYLLHLVFVVTEIQHYQQNLGSLGAYEGFNKKKTLLIDRLSESERRSSTCTRTHRIYDAKSLTLMQLCVTLQVKVLLALDGWFLYASSYISPVKIRH